MANNSNAQAKKLLPVLILGTFIVVGYALLVRIFALKE